jgi:hypothetical protein
VHILILSWEFFREFFYLEFFALGYGNIWGFWETRDLLNFSTFFSKSFDKFSVSQFEHLKFSISFSENLCINFRPIFKFKTRRISEKLGENFKFRPIFHKLVEKSSISFSAFHKKFHINF